MIPLAMTTADFGQTIEARPAMSPSGAHQKAVIKVFVQDGQGVQVFPLWDNTWRTGILEKLSRLGSLQTDWNSYGSPPPSSQSLRRASWFVSSVLSDTAPRPRVVPVADGGILFSWTHRDREVEIEFCPDSTIECLMTSSEVPDGTEIALDVADLMQIDNYFSWLTRK